MKRAAKLDFANIGTVGRKLDGRIEADGSRIAARRKVFDPRKIQLAKPGPRDLTSPNVDGPRGLRQQPSPVDEEQRSTVDADVPRVREGGYQGANMRAIVVGAVMLLQQDILFAAVPDASPVLVRPAQAEWKIRLSGNEDLSEGPIENAT